MALVQPVDVYTPPAHCVALTRYFFTVTERPDAVLSVQLHRAERIVDRVVARPLLPTQREALICLVSDLESVPAFEKSFLVTALNKGMFQIAAAEFPMFCYQDGKVQTRLWEKRRAEAFLFSRGKLLFD